MRVIYTQWDVGDTVMVVRDNGASAGDRRGPDRQLVSYYRVAVAGSGRIDLQTGQLNDRRRRR
jgi:hypothetical protein